MSETKSLQWQWPQLEVTQGVTIFNIVVTGLVAAGSTIVLAQWLSKKQKVPVSPILLVGGVTAVAMAAAVYDISKSSKY